MVCVLQPSCAQNIYLPMAAVIDYLPLDGETLAVFYAETLPEYGLVLDNQT